MLEDHLDITTILACASIGNHCAKETPKRGNEGKNRWSELLVDGDLETPNQSHPIDRPFWLRTDPSVSYGDQNSAMAFNQDSHLVGSSLDEELIEGANPTTVRVAPPVFVSELRRELFI